MLFPIILAEKRCARAARLPAVVETPLGKGSRGLPRPISCRVTSEADIPLDEYMPPSGTLCELVLMCTEGVFYINGIT